MTDKPQYSGITRNPGITRAVSTRLTVPTLPTRKVLTSSVPWMCPRHAMQGPDERPAYATDAECLDRAEVTAWLETTKGKTLEMVHAEQKKAYRPIRKTSAPRAAASPYLPRPKLRSV